MKAVNALRAALFILAAILVTAPFSLLIAVAAILPLRVGFVIVDVWRRLFMWLIAGILGIHYRVIGRENIPAQASVILSKHQSAWETVALQEVFPHMVFVLKRELIFLPFFGWSFKAMKMIFIDRKAGKDALAQVVEQGRERLAAGYWVTIFPEGTRVAPGLKKRYKGGGAHLAAQAGVAVVPVAHNAGEFWPRNAFIKRPGTVTVSVGPAIATAGLADSEIIARAEAWIEGEMRRISPHLYKDA
jgi:1-acyl-sn-glycerol-3-phosphate acyltransferase